MPQNVFPWSRAGQLITVNYSPLSGNIDPGLGIPGFSSFTKRLKVNLSGNTVAAGLPGGTDAQILAIQIASGAFTFTLSAFGVTAGKQLSASGNLVLSLYDVAQLMYDAAAGQWGVIV